MPTSSILISIIRRSTLLLSQLATTQLTWSSHAYSHQSILDIEFADDTAVYVQGDLENLKKLESGLAVFCKRFDAMIN